VFSDQDSLKEALEHYAIDDGKLDALASTAMNAVKNVWQQYHKTTREMIVELVKKAGKSGMEREKIMSALKTKGLPEEWIEDMIDELIMEGRCYESVSGVLKC
jgi:Na+-translocating ferredoxin:NAD+ oxidoreductase RnfC subunit